MKYIFIALVKFYRKFISPLKAPCCRFTPTCSQYALDAFRERGAVVGFGLTVWRILRCNPACKGGFDPVPQKKKKTKKENKDTQYLTDKVNGRK
ncbi:MAG: membrane protein insertion efficiency factor YidD [Clostridia bacterium]|nr:membrane protein insertion efficiency factor YidD [Clostridia bacterium]